MGVIRKVCNWYSRLSPAYGTGRPPYEHIVQIGDPRLRNICDPVPHDQIITKEIQKVIHKLKYVLHKYSSLGLSAPQIGVNLQIFVMQQTLAQISEVPKEVAKIKGLSETPLMVFVNPSLKVLDFTKVDLAEGCESVRGFTAEVSRYKEVEVTGYDAIGEPINMTFSDWAARIAQHEFDHLNGKLYTDIMNRKTLCCSCWHDVNMARGKLYIPFTP